MTLDDGTVVYHGSYAQIKTIDLARCRTGKDFGRGFYTTTSEAQARAFIGTSLRKAKRQHETPVDTAGGFVSVFRYRVPEDPIPVFEFESANDAWLWFVARNRKEHLGRIFDERLPPDLLSAQIVIGKIANDTTNRVITAYLDGLLGPVDENETVRTAISQLMPEKLHNQICFLSQRAVDCLELLEVRRYD